MRKGIEIGALIQYIKRQQNMCRKIMKA